MKRLTARVLFIGGVSFGVVSLTGCSAPPVPLEPPPQVQPTILMGGNTNRDYVECMLDAGWLSQEMESGGVIFGAPVDQETAFKETDIACMTNAGIELFPPVDPLTEEQFRHGHEAMSTMRDCLLEAGYPIGQPPSLQSYIDSDATWTPTADVPPSDVLKAEAVCPQASF